MLSICRKKREGGYFGGCQSFPYSLSFLLQILQVSACHHSKHHIIWSTNFYLYWMEVNYVYATVQLAHDVISI